VLRGILGSIHGQEARFARLAKQSTSWVKKVSAGIHPLREKTARRLELETGVALDWLMGPSDAPPVNDRGEPYTLADFEWHRARVKEGELPIRHAGDLFSYAVKIAAIGSAAGDKGEASLFLWRLHTFLDECAEEFGFDEKARALAVRELQRRKVQPIVFHDKGFDPALLRDKRVVRAAKQAAKGKAPGTPFKVKVTFPPEKKKQCTRS
jgi:hypothetical protein